MTREREPTYGGAGAKVTRPTEEQYAKLEEAYRLQPGATQAAAEAAGVSLLCAGRAWSRGWAKVGKHPALVPIVETLRSEIELARAARHQGLLEQEAKGSKLRADAKADAILARKEELDLVKAGRRNALLAAVMANRVASAADSIAKELQLRVNTPQKLAALELKDIGRLLLLAQTIVARSLDAANNVVVLERRIAGEPTEFLGITVAGELTTNTEGLLAEMKALQEIARKGVTDAKQFPPLEMPGLGKGGLS